MPLRGDWSYPTSVRFGAGRIAELADATRAAGMARPLFVTDPKLAATATAKRALGLLDAAGIPASLFADVRPNPVEANVRAGVAAFRAGGHDGIVALGGGSALDAGKLIAFLAGQSRPIWDFEDVGDYWRRADAEAIAPVVAVPTTAGTRARGPRAAAPTRPTLPNQKKNSSPPTLPPTAVCSPAP